MDEGKALAAMRLAYGAQKMLLGPFSWATGNRTSLLQISAACVCGEHTGVEVRFSVVANQPDRQVSVQLCIAMPEHTLRIARIDWRPANKHTNRFGTPDIRGLTVDTSIHPFEENAALGLGSMQGSNLPIALAIDPEPQNFDQLLIFVRDTFRISNAGDVSEPPWSPTLF